MVKNKMNKELSHASAKGDNFSSGDLNPIILLKPDTDGGTSV